MKAGWYPDPVTVGAARYWDGAHWTTLVSWGDRVSKDSTPPEEVDRLSALHGAEIIANYLAEAEHLGLIGADDARRLTEDLEHRVESAEAEDVVIITAPASTPAFETTTLPPGAEPELPRTAAPGQPPAAAPTAPRTPPPPIEEPAFDPLPAPRPTPPPPGPDVRPIVPVVPRKPTPAARPATRRTPPPPTPSERTAARQPAPRPKPAMRPAAAQVAPARAERAEPIPAPEPGIVRIWWEQSRHAIRSDLALHGLAYLGVVLMFAGIAGLIAFSFGDIPLELRAITELLVPGALLGAGWYLSRREAVVVGAALELLGAALLPIVLVASVTDGAPVPPDFDGRALPLTQGLLCLTTAAGMAFFARRDETSPLRFVCAPVAWLGAGLFAAIFRDSIPTGADLVRVNTLQVAAALTAWEPFERPWSVVPLAAALLAIAWATRRPVEAPDWARWDLSLFIAAHGVAGLALVQAPAHDAIAATYLATAVLSLVISVGLRAWPWAAGACALAIVGSIDAGPGWLALALLVQGIGLTIAGLQQGDRARIPVLAGGAASVVGSWLACIEWQSWSVPTVVYLTAPAAAGVALVAVAALRAKRVPLDLAAVWAMTGTLTSLATLAFVTHPDVPRQPGGLAALAALLVLATGAAVASSLLPPLRSASVGFTAAGWLPGYWAIEPSTTAMAFVMTLTAIVAMGAAAYAYGVVPSWPWIRPLMTSAGLAQFGAAGIALDALPDRILLIAVLLAIAAELVVVGVTTAVPTMIVAAPASACAAWLVYATDALSGNIDWFAVPIGVTVLVMVGLVRWIRRNRGGDPAADDVLVLEVIAMGIIVAPSLQKALTGQLWYGVVGILLGIALGLWGLITQVVRRGAFGIAVVAVSVLVLIGVPLADLEPWRGTSLWVSVTVIGVIAVTVAASIEQSRDRIERVRRRLDEMIEGWERRGSSILALEEGARAEGEVGHHASGKDVDVPSA